MVEKVQQTLRDSAVARWGALIAVSITMFCAYFFNDVMAPLKPMLEQELLWDSMEYGFFTSAYGWFNVIFLMLIFGGIILDKKGVRFTGTLSCLLMVVGCAIKYYAISSISPTAGELFGFRTHVMVASLGYAVFGVGAEIMGITVSKVIVRWFTGHELAMAMGMQVAIARLGSMLVMWITVPMANHFGSISFPLLISLIGLCIGFMAFMVYGVMEKTLDRQISDDTESEEPFKMSDIKDVMMNPGFWLIAILCLLFYSAVFPFMKYANDLMINKYGVAADSAGFITGLLPLGTLFLTPTFGGIYDKFGKGATIMIVGAVLLIVVHLLFALPILNYWWFATIIMIVLGIAFSLVPSAMWPSVAKIIPQRQLGTAYALIFWVQNIGLAGVPALIGYVLEKYGKLDPSAGGPAYDYTAPMIIFTMFGVAALIVAFTLKRVNAKKGYGLEEPNIK